MRTLKKALALVVVLAMALGTVATAVQYQDVAEDYDYAQAITLLSGLKVLQGDENGFRPEATITRAESCAVIYRMMSGNLYANNYAGATDFSDVAGSHWASGYINYCTAFGVIVGYPDGTFKPDAPVTFGEFVTMIVRALGCDKEDDGDSLNLTFPTGYMGVADQQGVLDSTMTLNADAPAFRGLVAQLAYNAIFEAEYMRAGYVSGKDEYYYETIAEKVFNMYEDTGIVEAYGAYNFGATEDTLDEDQVCIDGYTYTLASLDAPAYLYRAVTFWTDGDEIFAISLSDDNSEVTANAKDVSWSDDSTPKIKIAGTKYTNNVDELAANFDPDLTTTIGAGWDDVFGDRVAVSYTFISNDGTNSSFEAVLMKVYSLATIDLIDEDTMEYSSVTTDDSAVNISGYDLTADGLTADLGDVTFSNYEPEEDDTVMYIYYPLANGGVVEDANGDFEMYLIGDITGKYTSYSSTTSAYTIGGSKYFVLADDGSMTSNSIAVNDKVEATQLPVFGYIYDIDLPDDAASATADIYLVTKMGYDESGRYGTDTTYYLTAWGTDGAEAEYEVNSDATVNGVEGFDTATDTSATLGLVLTAGNVTDFSAVTYDGEGESGLQVYLAYLGFDDDGNIEEITPVNDAFTTSETTVTAVTGETVTKYSTTSDLLYLSKTVDLVTTTVKSLIKSDSASFFWNDADEEATVSYGTFPSDAENDTVVRYYSSKSYNPVVAALFDGEPTGGSDSDTDTYYGILIDSTVYGNPDDDDEAYIEYTIAADGKIATYATEMDTIENIDTLYAASEDFLVDGSSELYDDLVAEFEVNSDGEIVINATIANTFLNAVDTDGTTYVDAGTINSVGSGLIKIGTNVYEIASDANVYVTKASDSEWDPTTIGSLTSVKAETSSYIRSAVVVLSEDRTGDDALDAEVIDIFFFQDVAPIA